MPDLAPWATGGGGEQTLHKDAVNGYAGLDAAGKLKVPELPVSVVTGTILTGTGIDPTGATDSTTALQALLNTTTPTTPLTFILPPGNYKISAALSIPYAPGTTIKGYGRFVSTITQTTSGVPIIKFLGQFCHSMALRGLGLVYSSQQTTTGATAVLYAGTGIIANFDTFYHHSYDDLHIKFAGVCFGLDQSIANNPLSIWDCHWNDVHMWNTGVTAIMFVGTAAAGQPINTFTACQIDNTPNGGNVPTSYAVYLQANEVEFVGLDLEGWYNTAFFANSGGYLGVVGLHIEHHVFSAAFGYLFNCNSINLHVADASLTFSVTAGNTDYVAIVNYGSAHLGAQGAFCERISMNVTANAGSSYFRGFFAQTGLPQTLRAFYDQTAFFTRPVNGIEEFPVATNAGWRLMGDASLNRQAAAILQTPDSDFAVALAGKGLRVKEGANAKQGVSAAMVAGTVTVANTSVTANSRIFLTRQPGGTNPGACNVSAIVAATSFTITSTNAADTGTVAYQIFEPA